MRTPIFAAAVALVAYCALIVMAFVPQESSFLDTVIFPYRTETGRIVTVYLKPRRDGMLNVKGVNEKYFMRVSPREFQQKIAGPPSVIHDKGEFWILGFATIAYLLAPTFMLLTIYVVTMRDKRLRRVLAIEPAKDPGARPSQEAVAGGSGDGG